jgi:hypothetical protein
MKCLRLVLPEVSAPTSPMVDPFVGVYGATIVGPGAIDRWKYGSTVIFSLQP